MTNAPKPPLCTECAAPALTYEAYDHRTGEYTELTYCDEHARANNFCPSCGHDTTAESRNHLCICPECTPKTAA